MDHFVDERDYKLLEKDRYTFSVLARVMGGECTLLLTDHEKLIVCFSREPHPVWIWTPDGAAEDVKETAYALAKENGLLTGRHTFNLKYDLAAYFIGRSSEGEAALAVKTNLFAYDCPNLKEPHRAADGEFHRCTAADLDELVELMELFHAETGVDQDSTEAYRRQAEDAVKSGNHFFWRNAAGRNVAVCCFRPSGNLASVGLVYTRAAYRRRHYAENLVYQASKIAKDAGYLPILYTDADYVASNACYEKIGYVLRGKLCTIG